MRNTAIKSSNADVVLSVGGPLLEVELHAGGLEVPEQASSCDDHNYCKSHRCLLPRQRPHTSTPQEVCSWGDKRVACDSVDEARKEGELAQNAQSYNAPVLANILPHDEIADAVYEYQQNISGLIQRKRVDTLYSPYPVLSPACTDTGNSSAQYDTSTFLITCISVCAELSSAPGFAASRVSAVV